MKYCQKCGKEIVDEAVVCTGCGCSVEVNVKKTLTVERTVWQWQLKYF